MSYQEQTTAAAGAGELDPKLVTQDLAKTMEIYPECHRFLELARKAESEVLLKQPGFTTVFVPKSEALTKSLSTGEARQLVLDHVVQGGKTAADIRLMQRIEPLSGHVEAVSGDAGTLVIGGASILHADIACTNGFIHIIDRRFP